MEAQSRLTAFTQDLNRTLGRETLSVKALCSSIYACPGVHTSPAAFVVMAVDNVTAELPSPVAGESAARVPKLGIDTGRT